MTVLITITKMGEMDHMTLFSLLGELTLLYLPNWKFQFNSPSNRTYPVTNSFGLHLPYLCMQHIFTNLSHQWPDEAVEPAKMPFHWKREWRLVRSHIRELKDAIWLCWCIQVQEFQSKNKCPSEGWLLTNERKVAGKKSSDHECWASRRVYCLQDQIWC